MASWFDSHCHLHLCAENAPLGELVARAKSAGVSGMLAVGIDRASSRRARDIADAHGLVASAGVHPNSAAEWSDDAAEEISKLLVDERVVAVGETGLDFYWDECPIDIQRRAFADHIGLAKSTGKALVIHTRESVDATLDDLERTGPPPRLVFHCWSGDADQLRRAVDMGAHISFAGNVSFKSAGNLRAAVPLVPPDRLLVETDAPFLAPVPHRGKANEPAHVVEVGRAVALAAGISEQTVADSTTANALSLYGLN
jgi:TatD DNase family protein